jgi:hypothetical protein
MTDEDIRKLLGGYATNTLSEEEQKALYEAALQDDKLFAALADEHALREMLDDPQARAALLRAVAPPPVSHDAARRWLVPVSIAASVLVIASVVFVFNRPNDLPKTEIARTVAQPALQPEVRTDSPAKENVPAVPQALPQPRKPEAPTVQDEKKKLFKDAPPMVAATEAVPAVPMSAPAASTAPPPATGAVNAGKLQYTVLKRDTDGSYKAVDSGSTFASTDSVKLNVEAGESGFLEVTQKNPPKLLYGGPVEKQVPVVVPATGSIPLGGRNTLQIQFIQQSFAAGAQANAVGRQLAPKSLSRQKAAQEAVSDKAADQTARQEPVTIEVDLKVAPQSKQ